MAPPLAAAELLMDQFLAWLAERPRRYAETMEAWRSSCPRLSVWEDALEAGLVRLDADGAGMGGAAVRLTAAGEARLRRTFPAEAAGPPTISV
jgi:hypothetical protein